MSLIVSMKTIMLRGDRIRPTWIRLGGLLSEDADMQDPSRHHDMMQASGANRGAIAIAAIWLVFYLIISGVPAVPRPARGPGRLRGSGSSLRLPSFRQG